MTYCGPQGRTYMMVSVGSGLSKNDLLWSSRKDLHDGLC